MLERVNIPLASAY